MTQIVPLLSVLGCMELGRDFDRDLTYTARDLYGDAEMHYRVLHGPNGTLLYYGVIHLEF
jgi:hypothetical protein